MGSEAVWLVSQVEIHDSMDEGGQVSPANSTQPQQPPPACTLLRIATDPTVRSAAEAACLAEGSSPSSPATSAATGAAEQHANATSQPGGAALRAALAVVRSAGGNGVSLPQLGHRLAAAGSAGEHLVHSWPMYSSHLAWSTDQLFRPCHTSDESNRAPSLEADAHSLLHTAAGSGAGPASAAALERCGLLCRAPGYDYEVLVAAEHCRALLLPPSAALPRHGWQPAAGGSAAATSSRAAAGLAATTPQSAPAGAATASTPDDPRSLPAGSRAASEASPVPMEVDAPADVAPAAAALGAATAVGQDAASDPGAGSTGAGIHPWAGRPWLDHEGRLRPELWAMLTRQVQTLVARFPGPPWQSCWFFSCGNMAGCTRTGHHALLATPAHAFAAGITATALAQQMALLSPYSMQLLLGRLTDLGRVTVRREEVSPPLPPFYKGPPPQTQVGWWCAAIP